MPRVKAQYLGLRHERRSCESIAPRADSACEVRHVRNRDLRISPLDSWREHIRAVSAVLRRHRPGVGEEVDRNIADTACSSKPLCGPMGIEGVNGAKGGGAGKGKSYELRPWLASGRRKERWRGVAGEVMRCQPKGSGHTAAEADMTAGLVLVDGSRCSSSSS